MGFVANNIQQEVDELVRRIYKISDRAKLDSRQAFREAARPIVQEIQSRAPVSDEPHSRYLNGRKVATYYPGNLRRSIRTLTFKRSAAIFIGPKMGFGETTGEFKGNKTDGYYAHLMEFEYGLGGRRPQPFIRPGAAVAGPAALRLATRILKKKIDSFARGYEKVRVR